MEVSSSLHKVLRLRTAATSTQRAPLSRLMGLELTQRLGTWQSSVPSCAPPLMSQLMGSSGCLHACSPGVTSVRGPGQLVGEVSLFEADIECVCIFVQP